MAQPPVPYAENLRPPVIDELVDLVAGAPDESALFKALGESLGASATGDDPEERGRAVFRRRLGEIRLTVCGNATLKAYWTNPNVSDMTSIATSIAGALVASHFAGLNVVLVAALVARMGFRSLCSGATDD